MKSASKTDPFQIIAMFAAWITMILGAYKLGAVGATALAAGLGGMLFNIWTTLQEILISAEREAEEAPAEYATLDSTR